MSVFIICVVDLSDDLNDLKYPLHAFTLLLPVYKFVLPTQFLMATFTISTEQCFPKLEN